MASQFPIFNILQDMVPWTLKLWATKGPRDSRDQFTNDFLFACDHQLGDATFNTLANNVAQAIAEISHPSTRYLRAVVGPAPAKGGTKNSRSNFQSINFDYTGTRLPLAGSKACSLDVCATFAKTASYGPSGIMKFRGIFDENEITTNDGLRPDTVSGFDTSLFDSFGAHLQTVFEQQNCGMILPQAWLQTELGELRPLVSFDYTGVSQKQVRNHRHSLPQAEQQLFKREVNHLKREAFQVFKGLGGNSIAAAAKEIEPLVQALVTQFGAARIAGALAAGGEGAEVVAGALALAA